MKKIISALCILFVLFVCSMSAQAQSYAVIKAKTYADTIRAAYHHQLGILTMSGGSWVFAVISMQPAQPVSHALSYVGLDYAIFTVAFGSSAGDLVYVPLTRLTVIKTTSMHPVGLD